jgi:hypothetical protein
MNHLDYLNQNKAEQVNKENEAFHQLMKLLKNKLTADEEQTAIRLWVNGTQASEWVGWYDRAIIDQADKVAI